MEGKLNTRQYGNFVRQFEKFANRFKAGKEISEEDFMTQIKSFRISGSKKTVDHFEGDCKIIYLCLEIL